LHTECFCNHSEAVVLQLIGVFPQAVQYKDITTGFYPLPIACLLNQSEAVVLRFLIDLFPDAMHKDVNGCYPLQIARVNEQSLTVVL
jgi:hypothetical protein